MSDSVVHFTDATGNTVSTAVGSAAHLAHLAELGTVDDRDQTNETGQQDVDTDEGEQPTRAAHARADDAES